MGSGRYRGGMARQWVDNSGTTVLPVCDCGWRGQIEASVSAAWRAAAEHATAWHGDGSRARKALSAWESRHNG